MKKALAKVRLPVLASGLALFTFAMFCNYASAASPFPTYPRHHHVMATLFYIGEDPHHDNDHISNHASAWDSNWLEHYGGVDNPSNRNGWHPSGFTPKENPFYVALPYNDRDDLGGQKTSAQRIPWHNERHKSILKNFWVEVCHQQKCAYGQWEDVGPGEVDDIEYVFGNTRPRNWFGLGAGIDLSPAMNDYLEIAGDNGIVSWRFMYPDTVPVGPWWNIYTTRW